MQNEGEKEWKKGRETYQRMERKNEGRKIVKERSGR